MPLRSVEAATRDDAIAAAREQFGLSARIVGVRRIRSGGVLGFFATERFVAEVDPEVVVRPPIPASALRAAGRRPAQDPVRDSATESAREAARDWTRGSAEATPSRRPVPSRNAAAAYAAEARSVPASAPRELPSHDPVAELPGLLAGASEPGRWKPGPASKPAARPGAVRPPSVSPAWSQLLAEAEAGPAQAAPVVGPAPTPVRADAAGAPDDPPAGPSPFTAALARMVGGDREVQQAVDDALAAPGRSTETSVTSPVTHQEEEPVELQDWTPPYAAHDEASAAWSPSVDESPSVSREESIAEVLRAALAQGRSDEALAGILREVMDDVSSAEPLPVEPVSRVVADAEPRPYSPSFRGAPLLDPLPVSAVPVQDPVAALPDIVLPPSVLPEVVVPEVVVPEVVVPEVVAPVALPSPAHEFATDLFATSEALPEPVLEQVPEPVSEPVPVLVSEPWRAPAPSASELGWDDPGTSSLWADAAFPAVLTTSNLPAAPTAVPVVDEMSEAVPAVPAEPAVPAVEETADGSAGAVTDDLVADVAEETAEEVEAVMSPVLARTASDPAPLSLDATSVMPPLSLLPPLPGRQRGGRPPVPPSPARSAASAARPATEPTAAPEPPATIQFESLATVTRLPLAPATPPAAPVVETPPPAEAVAPVPVAPEPTAPPTAPPAADPMSDTAVMPAVTAPSAPRPPVERLRATPPARPAEPARRTAEPARRPAGVAPSGLLDRLAGLGLTADLLDATFTADLAAQGTYAALTRMLATRLPETPEVPAGAGDVLVVVGPGVETLRAARALAASLRLDPDRVQWATRGDLAGLAPASSRMTTIETAIDRRHDSVGSGQLTIVAVDAPLRTDAYWTAQMLAIWSPAAVWAVVEATRKPEDLGPWIEGLPRVDALVVQDTDLSADPAAVLHRVALPLGLPVAVVDGVRATPHRWASLLCERLENPQA